MRNIKCSRRLGKFRNNNIDKIITMRDHCRLEFRNGICYWISLLISPDLNANFWQTQPGKIVFAWFLLLLFSIAGQFIPWFLDRCAFKLTALNIFPPTPEKMKATNQSVRLNITGTTRNAAVVHKQLLARRSCGNVHKNFVRTNLRAIHSCSSARGSHQHLFIPFPGGPVMRATRRVWYSCTLLTSTIYICHNLQINLTQMFFHDV